ncbi:MAG: hypothetical protein J6N80_04800 [Bacteroidales bacterium]|nr:hypothetical protein [Bacteroidales bacterium]
MTQMTMGGAGANAVSEVLPQAIISAVMKGTKKGDREGHLLMMYFVSDYSTRAARL